MHPPVFTVLSLWGTKMKRVGLTHIYLFYYTKCKILGLCFIHTPLSHLQTEWLFPNDFNSETNEHESV